MKVERTSGESANHRLVPVDIAGCSTPNARVSVKSMRYEIRATKTEKQDERKHYSRVISRNYNHY